jgi:flagellar protein FliS
MANANIVQALQHYKSVGVASAVEGASPHRLVQMLLDGAIARVVAAHGCVTRDETARKGENISMAISILDGLRGSLDMEAGGEIASNLDALYEYMARRLLDANIKNDPQLLDEVGGLLRQIKRAWDAIPQSLASEDAQAVQGAMAAKGATP